MGKFFDFIMITAGVAIVLSFIGIAFGSLILAMYMLFIGIPVGVVVAGLWFKYGNKALGIEVGTQSQSNKPQKIRLNSFVQWILLVVGGFLASGVGTFIANAIVVQSKNNYGHITIFSNGDIGLLSLNMLVFIILAVLGVIYVGRRIRISLDTLWIGATLGGMVGIWMAIGDTSYYNDMKAMLAPFVVASFYLIEVWWRERAAKQ